MEFKDNSNIFLEIKKRKDNLKIFLNESYQKGFIDTALLKSFENKIDKDIITIGVIGQMKAGKSTFLNSFIFEDEVLPAATTPMTAALSVITYGEEKKIEAEFYSTEEWQEMRMRANRNIEDEQNEIEKSRIKVAKELVQNATRIGSELYSLLNNKKSDIFDNLIQYVGAEGKYVSITKSVTVYYPQEWLKGVRVVDTPGFNDPILSREQRTNKFLENGDVVLLLLYAGRPFDAVDRDILFNKVRKVGIGKVLIGINKFDLQYAEGESVEMICNNVKEELKKAIRDTNDSVMRDLLADTDPIAFSANMALLSKLSIDQRNKSENWSFHWNKICQNFEINSREDARRESRVEGLELAFKNMIENSKGEILFKRPISLIYNNIDANMLEEEDQGIDLNTKIKNLGLTTEEIEKRVRNLNKVSDRINIEIDDVISVMEERVEEILERIRTNLERNRRDYIDELSRSIDNASPVAMSGTINKLKNKVNEIPSELARIVRNVPRDLKNVANKAGDKLLPTVREILEDLLPLDEVDGLLKKFETAVRRIKIKLEDVEPMKIGASVFEEFTDISFSIDDELFWRSQLRPQLDKVRKLFSTYNKDIEDVMIAISEKYLEEYRGTTLKKIVPSVTNLLDNSKDEYQNKEQEKSRLTAELDKVKARLEKIRRDKEELQKLQIELAL